MLRRIIIAIGVGVAVLLTLPAIPTSTTKADNERGKQLFLQYCASCHGTDGKGKGTVAPELRNSVPDLTKIEKKNGKFPISYIQLVIAGEVGATELVAHGTRDMPVWGRVFRMREGSDRSRARHRAGPPTTRRR